MQPSWIELCYNFFTKHPEYITDEMTREIRELTSKLLYEPVVQDCLDSLFRSDLSQIDLFDHCSNSSLSGDEERRFIHVLAAMPIAAAESTGMLSQIIKLM